MNCGTMLRECGRYEALAKIMLYSDDFYNFFKYVEVSTFDIASDAFSTFKVPVLVRAVEFGLSNRRGFSGTVDASQNPMCRLFGGELQ